MKKLFQNAQWMEGSNTDGYGVLSIPHELDNKISDLIDQLRNLPPDERMIELSSIKEDQRATLLAFSERMASKAVRDNNKNDIVYGLIAVGSDGWRFDWRDNVVLLSLHYRSAEIIGDDPKVLFLEAAKFLQKEVQDAYYSFLNRSPKDRSIEVMGYSESVDADGFRYKRNW